jgi:hypothetical protein
LNYDSAGKRRTIEAGKRKGKVQKWRKSPLIRFSEGELVNGRFRIPGGRKIFDQLMEYVVEFGPDRWAIRAAIREEIPF